MVHVISFINTANVSFLSYSLNSCIKTEGNLLQLIEKKNSLTYYLMFLHCCNV